MIRQEAIGIHNWTNQGQGLCLFLTRGMTAWFDALHALSFASGRDLVHPGAVLSKTANTVDISGDLRSDLTTVLSDMVLACY